MKNFAYLRPSELDRAASLLLEDPAIQPLAGGTDLLDLMKSEIATPARVVDLKSVHGAELRDIDTSDGKLRIGALATLRDIAASKLLTDKYPVLQQAAAAAASPQLRNTGTLGGNLCQRPRCWYFRDVGFDCLRKTGDLCFAVDGRNKFHAVVGGGPCHIVHPSDLAVALTALDALVVLRRGDEMRSVPIREFYVLPEDDPTRETVLEPGEFVAGVEIPTTRSDRLSSYTKFRFRESWDFAVVSVALVAEIRGGVVERFDLALGGVAPKPWYEAQASAALVGKKSTPTELDRLAETVLADAESLGENGYKIPLARNLVRRAARDLLT